MVGGISLKTNRITRKSHFGKKQTEQVVKTEITDPFFVYSIGSIRLIQFSTLFSYFSQV